MELNFLKILSTNSLKFIVLFQMNIDTPVIASTENAESVFSDVDHQVEPSFDQVGGNRLQNILEMDLPRPKALLSHHGYDVGQGAIAGLFYEFLLNQIRAKNQFNFYI